MAGARRRRRAPKRDVAVLAAGVIGHIAMRHGDSVGPRRRADRRSARRVGRPRRATASTSSTSRRCAATCISSGCCARSTTASTSTASRRGSTACSAYVARHFQRRMIVVVIADDVDLDEPGRTAAAAPRRPARGAPLHGRRRRDDRAGARRHRRCVWSGRPLTIPAFFRADAELHDDLGALARQRERADAGAARRARRRQRPPRRRSGGRRVDHRAGRAAAAVRGRTSAMSAARNIARAGVGGRSAAARRRPALRVRQAFGAGWLVVGIAAVLLALAALAWAAVAAPAGPLQWRPHRRVDLSTAYLRHLDELEQQLAARRLTPRALHHELSRTLRRLASPTPAHAAPRRCPFAPRCMPGSRRSPQPCARYEHPQFEELPEGDPVASRSASREAVVDRDDRSTAYAVRSVAGDRRAVVPQPVARAARRSRHRRRRRCPRGGDGGARDGCHGEERAPIANVEHAEGFAGVRPAAAALPDADRRRAGRAARRSASPRQSSPCGRSSEQSRERETLNRDVMLCLDVSGSMKELDESILAPFIDIAAGLPGDRIGLTIWNGAAITVFPLTDDTDYVAATLEFAVDQLNRGARSFVMRHRGGRQLADRRRARLVRAALRPPRRGARPVDRLRHRQRLGRRPARVAARRSRRWPAIATSGCTPSLPPTTSATERRRRSRGGGAPHRRRVPQHRGRPGRRPRHRADQSSRRPPISSDRRRSCATTARRCGRRSPSPASVSSVSSPGCCAGERCRLDPLLPVPLIVAGGRHRRSASRRCASAVGPLVPALFRDDGDGRCCRGDRPRSRRSRAAPARRARAAADVLFVVDTTGSMAALDYDGDSPRLDGVRADIVELAAEFPGAHFSLIRFDSQARGSNSRGRPTSARSRQPFPCCARSAPCTAAAVDSTCPLGLIDSSSPGAQGDVPASSSTSPTAKSAPGSRGSGHHRANPTG